MLRLPSVLVRASGIVVAAAASMAVQGCMDWDYGSTDDFDNTARGLFIVCEGNFQYGNASLSFYDPAESTIENEIFQRANGVRLGDVGQSMTIFGDKAWVVVNNSHVVFAIDPDTYRLQGSIEGLPSPRYIHFLSDQKAYITQLYDNRIYIANPSTYQVTGYIEVPDMAMANGSTEKMVQVGTDLFCTCWSYQNRLIRIDTSTDRVSGSVDVGVQPKDIVVDKFNRLWVLTDGGYQGNPAGYEAPTLLRIDPETMEIELKYTFRRDDQPQSLQINGERSTLYWINDAVWRMDIDATRLPVRPFIESRNTKFYALTISPADDEVYVADAIDYQQPGIVYRYSTDARLIDQFYVGVTPGDFCWKQ